MKVANEKEVKLGKEVELYLPYQRTNVYNQEHIKLNSREIVYPNRGRAIVKSDETKLTIEVAGAKLTYPAEPEIESGEYEFIFKQDKLLPLYNKKMLKQGLENPEMDNPHNKIKVSAYDEDVLGSKLLAYVEVKGFENYASFVIDNKFSVYKNPKFELYVPRDAFELKSL